MQTSRPVSASRPSLPEERSRIGLAGTAPGIVLPSRRAGARVALPGPPGELRRLWPDAVRSSAFAACSRADSTAPPPCPPLLRAERVGVAPVLDEAGGDGRRGRGDRLCAGLSRSTSISTSRTYAGDRGAAAGAAAARPVSRQHLFAEDERRVEEIVLALARARSLTLATAESCTGGLVGARLTVGGGLERRVRRRRRRVCERRSRRALLGVPDGAARAPRRGVCGGGRRDGRGAPGGARGRRRRVGHGRRRARPAERLHKARRAWSSSTSRRPDGRGRADDSTCRATGQRVRGRATACTLASPSRGPVTDSATLLRESGSYGWGVVTHLRLFYGLPLLPATRRRAALGGLSERTPGSQAGASRPPGAPARHARVSRSSPVQRAARCFEHVLRRACRRRSAPELTVRRYRETERVGMLVLDDEHGHRRSCSRHGSRARLERLGAYRARAPAAGSPTSPSRAFASGRGFARRCLPSGRSVRPKRPSIILCCGPAERSTTSSKQFSRRLTLDRDQALTAALGQIERQFGKGSVMKMSDQANESIPAISTGCLSLDLALGIGGLPRGRIVEIFGPESSGKTTLVYHVIAEAQKLGGICAFVDAEHAMDPAYARRIGVNIDDLLVSQPDNGEQALEIAELLVRSGALDVVAIDSVAALTPKAEIEGEMGDSHVGLQARLMSQALRKLAGTLNRTGTVCIFTNQLREKIGVMFGNPETTPGRPCAEVLRIGPTRHPADRDSQGGRRGDRQPHPREGRQEQGGAAVQAGRVRHHLRRGHLLGGLADRRRPRPEGGPEIRLVLQLRRRAPRPGTPERDRVPARASRRLDGDRRPGCVRSSATSPSSARLETDSTEAPSRSRRSPRSPDGGRGFRAASGGALMRRSRRQRSRSRHREAAFAGRALEFAVRALGRRGLSERAVRERLRDAGGGSGGRGRDDRDPRAPRVSRRRSHSRASAPIAWRHGATETRPSTHASRTTASTRPRGRLRWQRSSPRTSGPAAWSPESDGGACRSSRRVLARRGFGATRSRRRSPAPEIWTRRPPGGYHESTNQILSCLQGRGFSPDRHYETTTIEPIAMTTAQPAREARGLRF